MHASPPPGRAGAPSLRWDLFCRVVDNFGDIGVCWRLARDLARRGQVVRLYTDDAVPLQWMAPGGEPGVTVLPWPAPRAGESDVIHADGARGAVDVPGLHDPAVAGDASRVRDVRDRADPGDVVVEAFGCNPHDAFVAAMARPGRARPPVWINLEYLSAEAYVERSHGLASPRMAEPGRGLTKWFFYPGYTPRTGGLLREPGLIEALERFDRTAWLASRRHLLGFEPGPAARLVSLFCYAGAPLGRLLEALAADGRPTILATAPGAASSGVASRMASMPATVRQAPLPWLSLDDYDRLLRASDLNLVRGEDSWVRAQWAGRPFVWQAYVQDGDAHRAKVSAFVDRLVGGAPAGVADDWRRWHAAWNGFGDSDSALPAWNDDRLDAVGRAARAWRDELARQPDLTANLLAAVLEKR
jgi:uncharacterized repeat protein (TIGR03837 family)